MDRGIERIRKLPYCIFRVKKKADGLKPSAAASNAFRYLVILNIMCMGLLRSWYT